MSPRIRKKYREARLVKGSRWYIVYYAWDTRKEELVRKRHFGDLNNIKNQDKRLKEALKIVREINRAFADGRYKLKLPNSNEPVKPFTNDKILDAFDEVVKIKAATLKENSMGHYYATNNVFGIWFRKKYYEDFKLKRLDTTILIDFADYLTNEHKQIHTKKKGVSNRTRNNYIDTIQAILNEINRRNKKLFAENPAEGVPRLPVTTQKHAAYSKRQIQLIKDEVLKQDKKQLMLFIFFIYYTLARPREIQRMRVKDIDLVDQKIFIPAENAKNNRDEYVDIYPPLADLIKKARLTNYPQSHFIFTSAGHPGEKRVHKDHFRRHHAIILKKLGLADHEKKYDLYGYKHTGAIALFEATKDPIIVKEQCRHQNLNQTMIYLRDLGVFRTKDHFEKIRAI